MSKPPAISCGWRYNYRTYYKNTSHRFTSRASLTCIPRHVGFCSYYSYTPIATLATTSAYSGTATSATCSSRTAFTNDGSGVVAEFHNRIPSIDAIFSIAGITASSVYRTFTGNDKRCRFGDTNASAAANLSASMCTYRGKRYTGGDIENDRCVVRNGHSATSRRSVGEGNRVLNDIGIAVRHRITACRTLRNVDNSRLQLPNCQERCHSNPNTRWLQNSVHYCTSLPLVCIVYTFSITGLCKKRRHITRANFLLWLWPQQFFAEDSDNPQDCHALP